MRGNLMQHFQKKQKEQGTAVDSSSRISRNGKDIESATIDQLGPQICLLRRTIFPGWTFHFVLVLPSQKGKQK